MDRILWVTDRYPPLKGGMAVSCARQVRALRRRGVRVDVLITGHPGGEVERDNGVDLFVAADAEPGQAANHAWLLALRRHTRAAYSHVVGFGACEGGFLATTFAAWLEVPSSVLVRGNDLDRDWFLSQRGWMVSEAFSRAGSIGAVTTEKAARIRALFPGKPVLWTPNSVDAARWTLLPGDEARRAEVRGLLRGGRVVGLIGELKAKKRIPFWLEAVRDRGLLGGLRLLIVGNLDGPSAAILE
ncbi:MAG: glycosyltransferase family 4 protein, partial [Acidobacteria bacterium]|nr:glycosyltransferase family 4 protein [Acidobacteriota bacterium]